MSETLPAANKTLPFFKNASKLRIKLLALQPGGTLDVKPEELPRSYKTVKKLISLIQKRYE